MNDLLASKKVIQSQKNKQRLMLQIIFLGFLLFFFIGLTFSFRNAIYEKLFPKPPTKAQTGIPAKTTSPWVPDASGNPYNDDGSFITAETSMYKVRFAYGGAAQGWFAGKTKSNPLGTNGGADGSIVELYYKNTNDPSSATRNLLFRNGTWGSGYDALDTWEDEEGAVCQRDVGASDCDEQAPNYHNTYNAPDSHSNFSPNTTMLSYPNGKKYQIREEAGRLIVNFKFQYSKSAPRRWEIEREYILYPWGKITTTANVKVINPSASNYLAHRFNVAGNLYSFTNGTTLYNWGTRYLQDGESVHFWTDGVNRTTGTPLTARTTDPLMSACPFASSNPSACACQYIPGEDPYCRGDLKVVNPFKQNYTAHVTLKRPDSWSGFHLDSANGNDPDIIVMEGSKSGWNSPSTTITQLVGTHPLSKNSFPGTYLSYIEGALYNEWWLPNYSTTDGNINNDLITQIGLTWFQNTMGNGNNGNSDNRSCVTDPANCKWNKRGWWDTTLGTWQEVFHVYLLPDQAYTQEDYLPLWKTSVLQSNDPGQQPVAVSGIANSSLDPEEQIYHLTAQPGSSSVAFDWKRASVNSNGRSINYKSSFIVKGLGFSPVVQVVNKTTGLTETQIDAYYSSPTDTALLTLDFNQPASNDTYTITLTNPTSLTPTIVPTVSQAVRIEAGSSLPFVDSLSNTWVTDTYFRGGQILDRGPLTISGTTENQLYQTERWGLSGYDIPVPNGNYTVDLHFAETYSGITGPGQRIMNISLEGQPALSNFDVYQEAGGNNIAVVKKVLTTVSDGFLNIDFTPIAQSTMINAIEIIPVVSSPTPLPTDSPTPLPTNTPIPTNIPTPVPTNTPIPIPTATPTPTPCPLLSAPTGLSPVTSVTSSGNVTFTWNAVPQAQKYAIRIDDRLNGWACTNPGDICQDTLVSPSFTATLQPGNSYGWWVHGINSCGEFGPATGVNFSLVAPTPTVTPTPLPTATPTPRPTNTPTPTPQPITQRAYTISSEISAGGRINEWKNSLIQVTNGLTLRQIGFSNTGSGSKFEIRRSTSTGSWGTLVASGYLGTTLTSGYYIRDISPVYLSAGYYTIHVYVNSGTYYYGTISKYYSEVNFLKSSAGVSDVNTSIGTYQIQLKLTP